MQPAIAEQSTCSTRMRMSNQPPRSVRMPAEPPLAFSEEYHNEQQQILQPSASTPAGLNIVVYVENELAVSFYYQLLL